MGKNKTKILIDALNLIADYDYKSGSEGICPYGCDTPAIARTALQRYAIGICQCKDVPEVVARPDGLFCGGCGNEIVIGASI